MTEDTNPRATVVEEGSVLKGALDSKRPVLVLGRVEGEVTGPSIEVAESGAISGKVKAVSLRSRGELAGQFDADDIELEGKVLDHTVIRAKTLQITSSGSSAIGLVVGLCELEVGEAPDKAAAIRDATPPAARKKQRDPASRPA